MIFTSGRRFIIFVIAFLVLFLIAFVPHGLLYQTSRPGFCNICHPMHEEYNVWLLTGLHRNIKCVDCHLPNNNIFNYLIWKSIDGTKDVFTFFTGIYPDYITATMHAKRVIKANCIKCHNEMVSRIDTEGMDCWSCHRRVNHKLDVFNYSDETRR